MAKGLVYIVKNPCFMHLIKIGKTTKETGEDRGLSTSNVPEDYNTIKAVECDDIEEVENKMHRLLDQYNHIAESGRKTEFYYNCCLEIAVTLLEGLKGSKDVTNEINEKLQEESEEADKEEIKIDPTVSDWISWEELRLMRDPSDKFITDPNAKQGWFKACNIERMTIVRQAKKIGKWNDKKLSKQWLIDSGLMDKLMNIQWVD
jgi:hypothetical protein